MDFDFEALKKRAEEQAEEAPEGRKVSFLSPFQEKTQENTESPAEAPLNMLAASAIRNRQIRAITKRCRQKANFNGNYPYGAKKKGKYRETTIDVGQFKPNAWGLYDMHGNVCEWCQVTYQVYPKEPVTLSQPAGPTGRVDRNDPSTVLRGGSWDDPAKNCRSAYRNCWYRPDFCSNFVGLRVALSTRPIQLSRGISEERLREVRRFLDI